MQLFLKYMTTGFLLIFLAVPHIADQQAISNQTETQIGHETTLSTILETTLSSAPPLDTKSPDELSTSALTDAGSSTSLTDELTTNMFVDGIGESQDHQLVNGSNMSYTSTENDDHNTEAGPSGIAGRLSISKDSGDENSPDTDSDSDTKPSEPYRGRKSVLPSRLNMTKIDQIYEEEHKSEREMAETWQLMGKKMKQGIGSIISSIMPMALNMSQEAQISSNCTGAVLKWVLSMNQLKLWALNMLDASGKPIAGLLEGSLTMFGNYRQCLKVRAPDDDEIEYAGNFREYFRGKYCVVQAKPYMPLKNRFYNFNTKIKALMETSDDDNPWYDRTVLEELRQWVIAFNFINIRMDICIPSMCTREDIQKAINFFTKGMDLKTRVLRCEMEPMDSGWLLGSQVESNQFDTQDYDSPVMSSLAIQNAESVTRLTLLLMPVIAIVFVIIASLISSSISKSTDGNSKRFKGKWIHAVKSFSIKRSIRSHTQVDYEQLAEDKPLALYGIRFILVLWVITVESAVNLKFEYLRELLILKDLIFAWPFQFIINSTLQFDSFILLAAFTFSYRNCLNTEVNNAKSIVRYVLDKYVRIMPSIMVMVAFVVGLPILYRGPVWNDYVEHQASVCQNNGWVNSVFLQNYLPYKEICLPQTWLLCVEFQLIILLAPLVYYLNKCYQSNMMKKKRPNNSIDTTKIQNSLGSDNVNHCRLFNAQQPLLWLRTVPGFLLLCCIFAGVAASFYNVYQNDLPPSWFYTMPDPESKSYYFSEHLTKLWAHLAVFAMGILAGIECRRASKIVQNEHRYGQSNLKNLVLSYRSFKAPRISHSSSSSSLPVMFPIESGHEVSNSSVSINIDHTIGNRIYEESNHMNCDLDFRSNRRSIIQLFLELIGCLMALATMASILFSTHSWSIDSLPKPLIAGLFDAGSRILWSLAFVWLLHSVSVPSSRNGKFSFAARSLGHPIMVSLGRLSFLIYIIYPVVHTTVLAIQEQPIYSSWLMLFHIFIGNMSITVILASLISLSIEIPFRNLFRRCEKSLSLNPSEDRNQSPVGSSLVASITSSSAELR